MRIVKVALAIVALAAPVASARAQEGAVQEVKAEPVASAAGTTGSTTQLAQDAGWNSTWALLFQLNNIFSNAHFLSEFNDFGIGVQYNLAPDLATRLGLNYGRTSTPREVTKNITETAGNKIETYTMSGGQTSSTDFGLRADLIYRLMPTAVAPYAGAGLYYGWHQYSTNYKDDVTAVDQVTTVNNRQRYQGFGLRGLLGAEWRLHSNFSIFAEYALSFTMYSHHSVNNDNVVENTVGGERTVTHTSQTAGQAAWLAASTDLTHNAQLGLAVHF